MDNGSEEPKLEPKQQMTPQFNPIKQSDMDFEVIDANNYREDFLPQNFNTMQTELFLKYAESNKLQIDKKDIEQAIQFNNENQDNLDVSNINSQILEDSQQSVNPDEQKYIIRDLDSGQVFDLRDHAGITQLENQAKDQIPSNLKATNKAWKQFFKNVQKNNQMLWEAAEIGDVERIKKILNASKQQKEFPAEINSRALDEWTALHFSVSEGHVEVVELLLKNGAFLEAETTFKRRGLHIAALRGKLDVVKILIDFGANINCQDAQFCTPLHLAVENNNNSIVQFLLQQKCDVSIKNNKGMTAYDLCNSAITYQIFQESGMSIGEGVYSRHRMGNVIRHDSRVDHVQQILQLTSNGPMPAPLMKSKSGEESKDDTHNVSQGRFSLPQQQNPGSTNKDDPNNLKDFQKQNEEKEEIATKSFNYYQLLGKGSFGEVYLAEKISDGQFYAMKVLNQDKIFSKNLIRYAQTEKNVLSAMDHPYIVQLKYSFQNDSKLFLVMDYCPGGDLGSLLTKRGKLPEPAAQFYISEILLALEALHRNMIIFRDLKPDNVVLDEQGHAQLTDFGLSKQGIYDNITQSFCGSIAYLPPEILAKKGHNRTVDWYLLGVMLYELLVGIPPYYSSKREELFENIKKGPLKIPKSMSEEAKDLIQNLLSRDPMQRLGYKGDAEDLQKHPFFKDINWNDFMARKVTPPFVDLAQKLQKDKIQVNFQEPMQGQKIENWTFIK